MKTCFYVDLFKAGVSCLTSVFSLIMTVCMLYIQRPVSAFIFGAVAVVFFFPACRFGSRITVTEKGIKRRLLWMTTAFWPWEDIAEAGVVGTRVFNRSAKKTGTRYIYISRQKMTDESRFDMILSWPPKDKLFFLYTPEGIHAIQFYYSSKIEAYNAGELHFIP